MAKVSASVSTNTVLIWVLLAIGIFALGALNLDYRHKMALLKEEVTRLEASQVLLMVPEQHADAIASWLTEHPEQTQLMLESAASAGQRSLVFAPDALAQSHINGGANARVNTPQSNTGELHAVPIVISESAEGVKVIRLPDGGIRVTTRNSQ
ncbi:MAG: membrane anchored protein in chemotaxis locus [Shewanella sp.]